MEAQYVFRYHFSLYFYYLMQFLKLNIFYPILPLSYVIQNPLPLAIQLTLRFFSKSTQT